MENKKSVLIPVVVILILAVSAFTGYSVFSLNKSVSQLQKTVSTFSLNRVEENLDTVIANTEGIIRGIDEMNNPTEKHEYKLLYTFREDDTVSSLENSVNQLGNEGWEYVGYIMNNGTNARVVLFKREQ